MKRDIIIGIDAGTSVIKSVAFTISGDQLAVTAIPNQYTTLSDRGVEQDMARTWADTATTLRLLAEKVPNLAERVRATERG
jgi:erythritol kinase (D-erythritol 1-phosphate-forming)